MAKRLEVEIVADASKYAAAMKDAEGKTSGFSKGLNKASLVATGALGAVALGGKKAVDAASDLGEQVSKTQVVFGKSGKEMEQWAGGLAHNFGLSQRAALEASGTFGNMLVPMGIARTKAAGMSKNMVQLAGDMASFNNASPEDTLEALRSGLSGEAEPLRKFGVFLDASRIQLEAVSSGLVHAEIDTASLHKAQFKLADATDKAKEALQKHGRGSKEYASALAEVDFQEGKVQKLMAGKVPKLTAAQKAQATYNLIQKDTVDTQGDFARTADSVANKQRIQAAETENLSASLGKSLLPAYKFIQQILLKVTKVMEDHQGVVKVLVGVIVALAAAVITTNAATKAWVAMQKIVEVTTKAWAAAQWLLNIALNANPISLVIIALVALGAALVVAWTKSETFRKIVTGTWDAIKTGAKAVLDFFKNNWPIIAVLISGPFAPLVALATNAFGVRSALVTAFTKVKEFVKGAVEDMAGFFSALPGKIGGAISGAMHFLWDALKKIFDPKVWKDKILGFLGFGSPSPFFVDIGKNIIGSIAHGVGKFSGVVWDAVKSIVEKINPLSRLSGGGDHSGLIQTGGLSSQVVNALSYARQHGWHGDVTSGFRTYAEQSQLYQRYLHGGPLAAKPGTSSHETGNAVDVSDYGTFGRIMAGAPAGSRLYNKLGAIDPVHYSVSGYKYGGTVPGPVGAPQLAVVHGGETITPHGGGTVINVHIAGTVTSERELTYAVRDALVLAGKRNGGGMLAGLG